MIVQQTKLFTHQKKNLHPNQIKRLDEVVETILLEPKIGEQKRGDLSFVRIYKFKIISQQYLLAYQLIEPEIIILLSLGTHENFYRDLKRSI